MESTPLLANPLLATPPVLFPITRSVAMLNPVEIHEPDFNKAIASVIWARHRRQTTSSIFNCHVLNCPLCQTTRAYDRPPVEGKRRAQSQQPKASRTDQPSVVNWLIPSSTPTPGLVADRKRASSQTSSPPRKRFAPSLPPSPDHRFQCPSCPKSFTKKTFLSTHRRIHTGHHVYCCQYCQKLFADPSSLIRHRRVHNGERPFRCSFEGCERDFAWGSSLSRHYKLHLPGGRLERITA